MPFSPRFLRGAPRALHTVWACACALLCGSAWTPLHAQADTAATLASAATDARSEVTHGSWQQMQPCPQWLVDGDADAVTPTSRWHFSGSLATTLHYSRNPEHKPSVMGSLDRLVPGNRFCGMTLFTNSFGQPSTYIYVGQQWDSLLGNPNWYARFSGGLLYGYVGKYQNKVPYNYKGFSPGLIPSVGYRFNKQSSVQLMILGTAGLMLAYGHNF